MTHKNRAQTALLLVLVIGSLLVGIVVAQFLPHDFLGLHGFLGLHSATVASGDEAAESEGGLWTCGMHPHVIEDASGQCPICGMDLTPMKGTGASANGSGNSPVNSPVGSMLDGEGGSAPWACPDHPSMQADEPGTCPIDGLDMVRTKPPEPSDAMANQSPVQGAAVQGAVVEIDPVVVQNMNVRTEIAVRRDLTKPIRTVGYLEFDQQRMVTVTTKYSGWIEKVNVNYVGEKVRRGEPLFEIYSPELVQTEQELLSALEFAKEMEDAPEDARGRAWSMVESARTRLGYWDITPQQITRLEETGEVFRTLEVSAPAGGLVMKRMAGLEGMAVQPGMELFHIADLSSLWLSVELFEDQLAAVREGTSAEMTLPYFPGETFHGRVRFLEPELSEKTRTMRAKIEIPNRSGRLRKGMYATVELQPVQARDVLSVPLQAVLRTGQRNVVVLALGEGRFAPVDVILGQEAEGFAEVLSGIKEGAEVVTSAQFLLDSESTLREAIQKMIAERQGADDPAMTDHRSDSDHNGHSGHRGH